MRSIFIVVVFTLLSLVQMNAQNERLSTIRFKDGSQLVAVIKAFKSDSIYLESAIHGNQNYAVEEVLTIDLGRDNSMVCNNSYRREYQISIESAFLANRDKISPSIQFIVSKRFNKLLYLGLGTGINIYDFDRDELAYPIFASAKLYLRDQQLSPFLQINTGYAFGIASEDFGISNVDGGLKINPRFGVEFGS